jgi:peptidoglycan/LPS O-acetylase OafA/YrhL
MMDFFSAKNTPTSVRGSSIAYRPELDGIRGFAVIIIIFHHFNYVDVQYFAGRGFLGVDIFFALSGFLITQILLSYREKGIKLRKFFLRRFARLYPILLS